MEDIIDNQYHRDCFFDSGNENWDWQNLSKKSHNNITNRKELNMGINIFEIVDMLNTELNTLSEAKDIIKEWAGDAHEDDAYETMRNLCILFSIPFGWRYDE